MRVGIDEAMPSSRFMEGAADTGIQRHGWDFVFAGLRWLLLSRR
jgi:hypothetical protein